MLKIIRTPEKLIGFFGCLQDSLSKPQFKHIRSIILAILVTTYRRNITGLDKVTEGGPHRTKRNDFVTIAPWEPQEALRNLAAQQLQKMGIKAGEELVFIIDDTHTRKRGKQMQGAGIYWDNALKKYMWGHNAIFAVIYYKGQVIPYNIEVHLKHKQAKKLKKAFKTLPEFAAQMIKTLEEAAFVKGVRITVLFDSFYMNKKVAPVVDQLGHRFVSVLANNRKIRVKRRLTRLGKYRRCIPKRQYRKVKCEVDGQEKVFYATDRKVYIPKIGKVKMVLSKRTRNETPLAIVTNDITLTRAQIIELYNRRWVIEVLFKSLKQYLGLGEYQTSKFDGVVRHLHLVSMAYILVVHVVWEESGKKGERGKTQDAVEVGLMRARDRMREIVFCDMLDYLLETKDPRMIISSLKRLVHIE